MSERIGYTTDFAEWDAAMTILDLNLDQQFRRPIESMRHLAKDKHSYATLPCVLFDDVPYVMHTKRFANEEQVMAYLDEAVVIMNIWRVPGDDLYWVRGQKRRILA